MLVLVYHFLHWSYSFACLPALNAMNMDISQMLKSGWLGCAGGEKRSKVSVACLTYLATDFSRHCTSVGGGGVIQ